MKTVGQIVTEVSRQLNDQYVGREFTRWTRAQLISYLCGALTELSTYKPEAFTEHMELTLAAGSKQTLADQYNELVLLESNADGSGITEGDLDLMRAFGPYTCCAAEVVFDVNGNPVYRAKSFAIDAKDTKTFYVDPAVPVGMTPKVNAVVYKPPTQYTLAEWGTQLPIPPKYLENVVDYMMGRAFDIDTESPMSARNADKHLSRFYTAMGVKYRVGAAYRAGNWNGAVGEGDPRARV